MLNKIKESVKAIGKPFMNVLRELNASRGAAELISYKTRM